jgi:uncharacterized protein (TIGR04255 family)
MSENLRELFPSSPRIIYGKAPLYQVLCQVRFPTILRIEASVPAEFQEMIQATFPLFERVATPLFAALPPELLNAIGQRPGSSTYNFLTEDRTAMCR